MTGKKRKLVSLVALTLILCMCVSVTAFASNSNNNEGEFVVEYLNDVPATSIGNTIDSGGDIITGGYGSITLYMDRDYYRPYFRAGATGNANNYVECTVTIPSGITYDLGIVPANGSVTPYLHYTGTAPSGYYTFHFYGTDLGPTGIAAFMYSNY